MSCEPVIRARNLGKCYQIYAQPQDRLKQFLWRGKRQYFREFWALHDVNFEIMPGEVVGIIGRNGSGKSTLLQLVCGTLTPTTGEVEVKGRIAALLELGAGFNPEFTGRENVFLSAAVLGLSEAEIAARYDDIVEFSGIRDFIDQPVKTYSSGMYVRLAFSVAISVDPDILVIDEALSVGDGEFSRKSFDRIMALKEAGKTILFCSHSMYQVEAICNRALWLNQGELKVIGEPARAIVAYNAFVNEAQRSAVQSGKGGGNGSAAPGTAGIAKVTVAANGVEGRELHVVSGKTTVAVTVEFTSDPSLPTPSVAVMFTDPANNPIASAGTRNDGLTIDRDGAGNGRACAVFEQIPLLKGSYWVYAFLMCENAVHFYEYANMVAQLNVTQDGLEMGVVSLPHRWE
ncbi:MAG: ABC transporter ATP-binding protein [Sulfuricella sp.]|nr:ABC transporter ATP-binding protein [Sulfuricella sp.]